MLYICTWCSVRCSHDAPSHYLPDAHAEPRIPAAAAMRVGVEILDMMSDGGEIVRHSTE